jgi:hypothetical protein
MRTLRVLWLTLAAALAGAAIAAAHSDLRQMVICPGAARPGIVQCCPLPINIEPAQPVCCNNTILPVCQPSLTIGASPDPTPAGGQVDVSGALLRASGAGMSVQLWQKLPGQKDFTKAQQATIAATGSWSVTLPAGSVMTNRAWYATADGLQSTTVNEQVSAVVTLVASKTSHSATLRGTVTPSHSGERVLIQRLVRNAWVTIGHARLGHKSRFTVRYRNAPTVRATVRAVLPADATNVMSVSRPLTAVVFPRVTAK